MEKKSRKKTRKSKPAPPPPAPSIELSNKWFTEQQMFELFGATKPILNAWRALGLQSSQPTGSHFFNETDVQQFMIWYRKKDDSGWF